MIRFVANLLMGAVIVALMAILGAPLWGAVGVAILFSAIMDLAIPELHEPPAPKRPRAHRASASDPLAILAGAHFENRP